MNFNFSNLFQKREAIPKPEGGEDVGSGASFTERKVHIGTFGEGGMSVAAYYRALMLRANTMSQLLMQYQRFSPGGKNYYEDNRGRAARINYLTQVKPNPRMTWPLLVRLAEIKRVSEGNAYIYIEREADTIKALWLCHEGHDTYNAMSDEYTLSYDVDNKMITTEAENVIHLRNDYSRNNGISGVATLVYMNDALTLAATNDRMVLETAAKGGRMKFIVQEEKSGGFGLGRANKKELEKITQKFREDIVSYDAAFLSNVAGITPISQNLQQQEVQIARAFSVREIARFMGVPAVLLMDDSNSSYKSPEAATLEFLSRTIAPLIREWEAEFNSKLLDYSEYGVHRFHFCEKPLFRMDMTTQVNVLKNRIDSGLYTINEGRAELDMPAVEGGDKTLVTTNVQPLDNMRVTGNKPADPIPPANGEGEEGGEP